MSLSLQQGRIVWVELFDPQGRNPKVRPAVILSSTPEILPEGEIVVAALSSQLEQSPPETSVAIPWHRDGHPKTKLNRRNVVVCTWLTTLPVTTIGADAVGGVVPFAQMVRILEIVRSLREDSAKPLPPESKSDP